MVFIVGWSDFGLKGETIDCVSHGLPSQSRTIHYLRRRGRQSDLPPTIKPHSAWGGWGVLGTEQKTTSFDVLSIRPLSAALA